jgi:LacI family transcriptional regulator, repressor for deo operon, udp, cdd, tsx, nupC, and nupG
LRGAALATILDVAKLARVSSATVSRVLNDSPSVSAETREHVLQCIRSLGYEPNYLGRNLRRAETRIILVLLPTIANPFYAKIVQGLETAAHLHGYDILIGETGFSLEREKVFLSMLKNRLTDGIVFLSSNQDKNSLEDLSHRFPIVQCCEYIERAAVSHVSIDNFEAAREAAACLIGLGHRRIGFISCRNGLLSNSHREKGVRQACKDAGLALDKNCITYAGDYTYPCGILAMEDLLRAAPRPTAVFCVSDELAAGAVKCIEQVGLCVPGDLSVVGFDDTILSAANKPAITTIAQPQADLGKKAFELLINHIKNKALKPAFVFLKHELIVRESTSRIKNKEE